MTVELFEPSTFQVINEKLIYTGWKVSVFEVFLVHIFPYSDWIRRDLVRMREITDQKNSEYGHFLHIGRLVRLVY